MLNDILPWLLWGYGVIAPAVAGVWLYKKRGIYASMLPVCVAALLAMLLYQPFLTGEALFLYASYDGHRSYLPAYMSFIQEMRGSIQPSFWDFSVGFGTNRSYDLILYPLNLLPVIIGALFGENAMMIAFAWMQVLKITLAAFFTVLFLKKLGIQAAARMIGSIMYAFSGVIILRGFWNFPADECWLVMLLLWTAECYFQDNKWYLIPLVIVLMVSSLGFYYIYLYALLLALYAVIRYIGQGEKAKGFLPYLFKAGGVYLLGVLMSAVILLGFSFAMFETERFADTASKISLSSIFSMAETPLLITTLLSLFDTSSTGVFSVYWGVLNYLEHPLFYCGLMALYLIPQAFALGEKRERGVLTAGTVLASCYVLFPFAADVMNAFIRNEELGTRSYRLSGLWICIFVVAAAAYGMQCILKNGGCSLKVLQDTALVIITVFLFCCVASVNVGVGVDYTVGLKILLLLLVWPLLLRNLDGKRHRTVLCLIVCLCMAEAFQSAAVVVEGGYQDAKANYESMMSRPEGYYGDTADAIDYIQKSDPGFYRTALLQEGTAPLFSAPSYWGIMDSSYYTSINSNTYQFLNEVYPESFLNEPGNKSSVGVGSNLFLAAMTGYRYLIRFSENIVIPYGYEKVHTIGNTEIYQNQNSLPLGILYDEYITRDEFSAYTKQERQLLLLNAVVLDGEDGAGLKELTQEESKTICSYVKKKNLLSAYVKAMEKRTCAGVLQEIEYCGSTIQGTVEAVDPAVLMVSIPNEKGWHAEVDGAAVEIRTVNLGFIGIPLEPGSHHIKLYYRPVGILLGAVISTVALLGYLVAALISVWKERMRRGRGEVPGRNGKRLLGKQI